MKRSVSKGQKPDKDFPLSFHKGSGQWCRKIRGKVWYFGADANAALDKWLAEKVAPLAGKNPGRLRPTTPETI